MNRHPERPPDIPRLLALLVEHDVRYVIGGSVAALLHGVELEPADLDIIPATDRDNLVRLVEVIRHIGARPGALGHWETTQGGERRWIADDTSEEALAAWTADPDDVSTIDHLFSTSLGNFDVVPEIAGTYETLMRRAAKRDAFGLRVLVAHVDEILAKMTIPRREKDVPRVKGLREIQRRTGTGGEIDISGPTP